MTCDNVDDYLVHARLAVATYYDDANVRDDAGNKILPPGWVQSKIYQNDATGLSVSIFESHSGDTVISFRGTNDLKKDGIEDVTQAILGEGKQYDEVQAWAQSGNYPNATVIGHSLGGGLAAVFGAATGLPTIKIKGMLFERDN